jgi:hypothetical protein
MIVVYNRSFIVLANGVTVINYDRKGFIVQATGHVKIEQYYQNGAVVNGNE